MLVMDSRTYIRLHDGMPDHPKIVGLSDAAFRLYVEAMCWCSRHLTDGHVSAAALRRMGGSSPKTIKELAEAGLFEVGEEPDWEVHDYLHHQRSAAQVEAAREQRRNAGRAGGKAKKKRTGSESLSEPSSESLDDMPSGREAKPKQETETETEIQDPSDPAPPTADADDNVLRLAANGQPAPRKGRRKQAQVTDPNAGTVVAAWVEAVEREQGERPAQRLVAQVGRQARELIEEGKDPARLIAAATAAGGKGFADLGRELLRMNGSGQRQAPRSPGATPSQYSDEDYANASFKR